MSAFAHHPLHRPGARSQGAWRSVHARLIGIVRRIADGSLEQPVLHVLDVPMGRRATTFTTRQRPHAHWNLVSDPGGARHLEATWQTRH
ncbi:hypothetical protein [Streptomyces sp. NPDC048665]|uniref:hypothetical protein n=1 Tax=Streptomyces sp. NPDC048665 TaxID=3155490 RepID=UPI00344786F1